MIELRYNADGKLEYRIIKLGGCGSPIEWHEWIVVPNVEKVTESSASRGLHTERVTLEITHDGTESVATQKFWDRVLKPDPWFGEHVKVVSELDQIRESCDRVSREEGIKTLSEEISAQNKVIEELKKEKAEDWKAACESARIASGTVYDLKRKYEKVKKELDEIKNSSAPITWGVRNTKDSKYRAYPIVWSCRSTEALAKIAYPERDGWEHFPLYSGPKYTITKEDIDQLSCIADRLDYAQFYESANSLRSFIARNR